MVNKGEAPLRVRADSHQGSCMTKSLNDARRRVVEILTSVDKVKKSGFRMMSVSRYQEVYGKHPCVDNYEVVEEEIEGELVEVVFIRKLPNWEWDCDVEERESARKIDAVDDGVAMTRATQQETKFKSLASKMTAAPKKAISAADLARDAEAQPEAGEDGQGADGDSSGCGSNHGSVDNEDDDVLNCIVGGAPSKAKARAGGGSRASKNDRAAFTPRATSKPAAPLRRSAQPSRETPKSKPPVALLPSPNHGEGKAKRGRKRAGQADDDCAENVEAERYLAAAGKTEVDEKIAQGLDMLRQDGFATVAVKYKDFQALLKAVCDHFRNLNTKCVGLQWKIKKRTNPPESAVEAMQKLREEVGLLWSFCLAFMTSEEEADAAKMISVMDSVKSDLQGRFDIPLCFQAL